MNGKCLGNALMYKAMQVDMGRAHFFRIIDVLIESYVFFSIITSQKKLKKEFVNQVQKKHQGLSVLY